MKGNKGWYNQPGRHVLASKGVSTTYQETPSYEPEIKKYVKQKRKNFIHEEQKTPTGFDQKVIQHPKFDFLTTKIGHGGTSGYETYGYDLHEYIFDDKALVKVKDWEKWKGDKKHRSGVEVKIKRTPDTEITDDDLDEIKEVMESVFGEFYDEYDVEVEPRKYKFDVVYMDEEPIDRDTMGIFEVSGEVAIEAESLDEAREKLKERYDLKEYSGGEEIFYGTSQFNTEAKKVDEEKI